MNENARWDAPGGFSALPAGTVLDRYRIDSVIAAGGFGITYLCHHVTLGKPYALKEHFPRQFAYRDSTTMDVLPTDPGTFKWALERFVQEGQALARCSHPNVVDVADVFEANQTAYMVLGYEEGRSLKTWLDMLGRRPTQAEIDAILSPLLDALAYVHAQGLLHRDIAPDNIMIRSDGNPCLIDFGSARQAVAERSQMMSALIKSGYSPPEQYTQSSRTQGPWSDIYAMGATLYRAVAGQTPPEATERAFDDALTPLREAVSDPLAYRASFLDGVEEALAFHYAKRPQSIAEWRAILFAETPRVPGPSGAPDAARPASTLSLGTVTTTPQGTVGEPLSRSRGGKALAAVAALLLLLGGGGAIGWSIKQAAIEHAATLKIEEERIAREKAAAADAQRQADQDARMAREKAERDRAAAERAAALERREQEAQQRAAEERAERERAESKRAEEAATAAAQSKAAEAARIARAKADAERAAALKHKLDEDTRVAREKEAQRRAAEEQARQEKAERERAEQAARQKAEDDARIARETAERDKAEAERAAALQLKAEEDARLAREQEAQRKADGERIKREQAEKERAQKAAAAAAAAAAARNKATNDTKKTQKAEPAKREPGTNCPSSALKASHVLWNRGEIRSGGTVTARHPCGRSMECSGGFGGSGGFGRTCRWL